MRSFLLACSFLAACGSGSLRPTDYDQRCTRDEDCVARLFDGACACTCDWAAINRADLPRYEADLAKLDCTGAATCGACQAVRAACGAQGTCIVAP